MLKCFPYTPTFILEPNNNGEIFDVAKLKDTEFAEVPYKTLLKILNRLDEEGLLSVVSKGVYFIGEKPVGEELIFDEYIDDGKECSSDINCSMTLGYPIMSIAK